MVSLWQTMGIGWGRRWLCITGTGTNMSRHRCLGSTGTEGFPLVWLRGMAKPSCVPSTGIEESLVFSWNQCVQKSPTPASSFLKTASQDCLPKDQPHPPSLRLAHLPPQKALYIKKKKTCWVFRLLFAHFRHRTWPTHCQLFYMCVCHFFIPYQSCSSLNHAGHRNGALIGILTTGTWHWARWGKALLRNADTWQLKIRGPYFYALGTKHGAAELRDEQLYL